MNPETARVLVAGAFVVILGLVLIVDVLRDGDLGYPVAAIAGSFTTAAVALARRER